jgi:type I restriction enzyme S subunit
MSEEQDVIVPSSGETAIDIATARCVLFSNIALGGDLNIIRSKSLNGSFLAYQLNGIRKYDIAKIAQGSSIIHLYATSLSKIPVSFPSLVEQEKIAAFLSLIDERIEVEEKLLRKYEEQKRYLLQQMFV